MMSCPSLLYRRCVEGAAAFALCQGRHPSPLMHLVACIYWPPLARTCKTVADANRRACVRRSVCANCLDVATGVAVMAEAQTGRESAQGWRLKFAASHLYLFIFPIGVAVANRHAITAQASAASVPFPSNRQIGLRHGAVHIDIDAAILAPLALRPGSPHGHHFDRVFELHWCPRSPPQVDCHFS